MMQFNQKLMEKVPWCMFDNTFQTAFYFLISFVLGTISSNNPIKKKKSDKCI